MQSFGQIASQTLQRLHPNEFLTEVLLSITTKTLLGHAITHFSQISQSSQLISNMTIFGLLFNFIFFIFFKK